MDRKRKLDVAGLADEDSGAAYGGVNPYTGRQYSSKYYQILSKRKGGAL